MVGSAARAAECSIGSKTPIGCCCAAGYSGAGEHGRGLLIIAAIAAEWGMEQWDTGDGDRCCVWARIEDLGAD